VIGNRGEARVIQQVRKGNTQAMSVRSAQRQRPLALWIAMALAAGGATQLAHAGTTPPTLSSAWAAQRNNLPGNTPASAAPGTPSNLSAMTPGQMLQQRSVQQSIANLAAAAQGVAAQMAAQAAAASGAAGKPSNVPNGLGKGGLQVASHIGTDPSLWQNADAPTQSSSGGQTTVTITQTDQKAILNWDSFNVGRQTTVYFNQSAGNQSNGSNDWIALNRINDPGTAPSTILGHIKAEGTVYLLNRNGILFGAGSQVDTHSLLASSLDLFSSNVAVSNQDFLQDGIESSSAQFGLLIDGVFTDGNNHDVVIEQGASITTGAQGFALIAAPNVSNAGSIVADDGQIFFAAGVDFKNTQLSGQLGILNAGTGGDDPKGLASNTGLIQSRRGQVHILGYDIDQNGVVLASTSISHPGSIEMTAFDENPGGGYRRGGALTLDPGSVTAVLPEKDGTTTSSTAAADDAFVTGSLALSGHSVTFQSGSLVDAPGADLSVLAQADAGNDTRPDAGRIYLDDGAIVDVSGIADIELPMSALLVSIPRIGQNELADSPSLRDSFLYTQKNVVVDSSQSGTRADGLDWIGSPILNVGGYVDNVPRTIEQMLTSGGTISLTGVDVIARSGSQLHLDGGYVAYQAGWVTTPNLVDANGLITNIADADPNVDYVGFAGQYTVDHQRWGISETYTNPLLTGMRRWDTGFVVGGSAGSLTVSASNALALNGDVSAQAYAGRNQVANDAQPAGGSLVFNGTSAYLPGKPNTWFSVLLQQSPQSLEDLVPDFGADTPWSEVVAAQDPDGDDPYGLQGWLPISADMIAHAGFSTVTINSGNQIREQADTVLSVRPGGSINLTGGGITVLGELSAPAGSISLTSTLGTSLDGHPPRPDITVGDGAELNVDGLWVNDSGLTADSSIGDRYINGGSISLTTDQTLGFSDDDPDADGTGSIILQSGSLLSASSGGYVGNDAQIRMTAGVPEGHGGDISLRTYVGANGSDQEFFIVPSALDSGAIEMDGQMRADGFSGGGTLTLRAPLIQIGGDPANMALANGLYLAPSFFADQGFDNYALTSITDATIAPDSVIQVRRDNLLPNYPALLSAPTGSDLYASDAAHPDGTYTSIGQLDPYHRYVTRETTDGHGPGLSISAGNYQNWDNSLGNGASGRPQFAGVTGSLSMGEGSSIVADAGATVSLTGYQNTIVLGTIDAPGGDIAIATAALNDKPTTAPQVWLGAQSVLDASGISLIDPWATATPGRDDIGFTPRTGIVLAGGTVSLTGNSGYVLGEAGSRIDVSGAADTYDLPATLSGPFGQDIGYAATPVWSDAGSIELSATQGLYLDSTLQGHGGSAQAEGGSLSIVGLSTQTALALPGNTATGIVLQQSGDLLPAGLQAGGTVETKPSGVLHFAADRLQGSGISSLVIGPDNSVLPGSGNTLEIVVPLGFAGDVNLSLGRSFVANASAYIALPAGSTGLSTTAGSYAQGAGTVHIDAPYVDLSSILGNGATPVARAGDGRFEVDADFIDMGGWLDFEQWADVDLTSSGDLRFYLPPANAYSQNAALPGLLFTTGDISLRAAQMYPASDYHFVIDANASGLKDAAGNALSTTVSILPNGPSSAPLSAGGALLIDADHIEQQGTIRVPSGDLVLGVQDPAVDAAAFGLTNSSAFPLFVTQSVHLADGSITSVSLDGLTVPYGTTVDGTDWRYSGDPAADSTDLAAPPSKQLSINGTDLSLDAGATIDLSGGGDLQASEWNAGVGGSRDVLSQYGTSYAGGSSGTKVPQYSDGRPVYAIVPGYSAPVGAHDAALEKGAGDGPAVGQSVYLSGIPGLPAGMYTLLPAKYATLKGAYRIVQDTGMGDVALGRSAVLPDGTISVTGYFADALTGARDARNTSFELQSGAVWQQYSQYTLSSADTYFSDKASKAGTVAPLLPDDAGHLVLGAGKQLNLGASLTAAPADGGRGSQVDIAAQAIQVVGDGEASRDGYLVLSADGLTTLGAGSLLLGGTRSLDANGDLIDSVADSVVISNDAAHPLAGQEILLVANGSGDADAQGVQVLGGSVMQARGDANGSSQQITFGRNAGTDADGKPTAAVSGDGAMLRVSQNGAATVVRNDVSDAASGQLGIGDGAVIDGGSALTLDATGSTRVDPSATFSATAIDANSNLITFTGADGNVDPATAGLVIGPNTLNLFRQSQQVTLRSRGAIDFVGDVDVDLSHGLELDAGAFVSDGGQVSIEAGTLGIGNALGATVPTFADGNGRLALTADEIDFTAGTTTLQGFGGFTATARTGMAGQGAGGVDFGTIDVTLNTPLFMAESGANTALTTTGTLSVNGTDGTAFQREAIGGALTLTGGSLSVGTDIEALAGNLSLTATDGDLAIGDGATLSTAGINKAFFDTNTFAAGGALTLTATEGSVDLQQGATLDFAGAAQGGDAGSMTITAGNQLVLNGQVDGHAQSGFRSGYMTLDSGGALDLDAIAQLADTAGVHGAVLVTTSAGNLALSAGHTLAAQNIYLSAKGGSGGPSADDGNVVIDGTLDASGASGANIQLYGSSSVDVEGSLLATSSIPEQRGGNVVIGTSGVGDGTLNDAYGYENVQANDSGSIHLGAGARIDVSGGSDDAFSGGSVSLRAPLLADGDVRIAIDGGNSTIVGARVVTLEPFATWSTTDAVVDAAKHFDGMIDPAGWYQYGADGKPALVDGTWTDASGKVLDAPANDDQLKQYLSTNYFTPTAPNADHQSFYGYLNGDASQGPGTLMGFVEQPGFSFGNRYAGITNLQLRPGIELDNPLTGPNGGDISVLTNWNLAAGVTNSDGSISLAYRYNGLAPILTVEASKDLDIRASITDGFYQQNDGAVLDDPSPATPPVSDNGYNDALAAYNMSQKFLDDNDLWNGTIKLAAGGTASLLNDPNYQPIQAPLTGQAADYYTNYEAYINEVGTGDPSKSTAWEILFWRQNVNAGFLTYRPDGDPEGGGFEFGDNAPLPSQFPTYAAYQARYEAWLEWEFWDGYHDSTPTPLLQPIDNDYGQYSSNYVGIYIPGHTTYDLYINLSGQVGSPTFGTQLFYAPFAPNAHPADGSGGTTPPVSPYDQALTAYKVSQKYLDDNGLWNGTINLNTGDSASLLGDPNYQAIQAPLQGQSTAYYGNYAAYIHEVGNGDAGNEASWAAMFWVMNDLVGFQPYSPDSNPTTTNPNGTPVPDPTDPQFATYADYATAYQNWLQSQFFGIHRSNTPPPLMQPISSDYTQYSGDYTGVYIPGHATYDQYVYNSIGNDSIGSQLFYAPFAPHANIASSGNPDYDAALAAYKVSQKYLDDNGLWNGTINLNTFDVVSVLGDPNYQAIQAPLQDQSKAYYGNYKAYIGEVGNGDAGNENSWAYLFWEGNAGYGFEPYSPNSNPTTTNPNGTPVPDPTDPQFATYADYATAYQNWLQSQFGILHYDTTPTPLMQPISADYTQYSGDYTGVYIPGHAAYDQYVAFTVGSIFYDGGSQLFYAPFAPNANAATGGGDGGNPTTVPVPASVANNSPSNMPSLGSPASLVSATLLGGSSTSYRLVAGAAVGAADPLALGTQTGNVNLDGDFAVKDTATGDGIDPTDSQNKKYAGKTLLFPTVIRTGTGSIDIAAAGDIDWLDAAAPTAIYTAGEPADDTSAGSGVSVTRSVVLTNASPTTPDMLVNGLVNPDHGGDISLTAQGDINSIEQVFDTDGSITKGDAGTLISQFWWQWMQVGNAADGSRTSIDFANFDQGVMSVGGNVAVSAGGDIRQLSVSLPTTWVVDADGQGVTTIGGGNLDVQAGGDILSGSYFVARGQGRIAAGGSIGADFDYTVPDSVNLYGGMTTPVSTLLALQDAQLDVSARQGADIGGIYNPSYFVGGQIDFVLPAGHFDAQAYSADSSVSVMTTGGNLLLDSLSVPGALFDTDTAFVGNPGPVLPATISLAALNGDIDILGAGSLFPSATGNLTLLADDSVNFSQQVATMQTGGVSVQGFGLIDAPTSALPSPLHPYGSLGTSDAENANDFGNEMGRFGYLGLDPLLHQNDPLHGDDNVPVRIYALNGDIVDGIDAPNGFQYDSLVISPDKQALVYAGRDIVDLSFEGQHTHDADVTRIAAGRDIYDTALPTQFVVWNSISPGSYELGPSLLLGGPGDFLIEAGRNVGPLTNQSTVALNGSITTASGGLTGIDAVGNTFNSYLPHQSANVNVLFGVGPGVDTAAFVSTYLDAPNGVDGFGSLTPDLVAFMEQRAEGTVVDTGYAGDKLTVTLDADQARTMFDQLPDYVQRLFVEKELFKMLTTVGSDYNDPTSAYFNQYARGYAALDTLFPASLGYTSNGSGQGGINGAAQTVDTGDLDIRSSTIQTQQGGDISILGPGGQALVGSASAPPVITDSQGTVKAGPNTMGILTLEKGDVDIFTDRSVLLAQSRIFTEQGGDLTMWSSNGDINAGQGAKTVAEIPPPTYLCTIDAWCRIDARGQVSGAGIGTLQTIAGAPTGNAYLVAPRGTVDAGDAGIRVSGNLVIAAAQVLNADNIQVQGEKIGVPVAATVDVGALSSASAAASAINKVADDLNRKQQSDARSNMPSIISVQVLGFGDGSASIDTGRPAGKIVYNPDSPVQVLGAGDLDGTRQSRLTAAERQRLLE
jgi:filamentous hemagglutinin family protein